MGGRSAGFEWRMFRRTGSQNVCVASFKIAITRVCFYLLDILLFMTLVVIWVCEITIQLSETVAHV